MKKINKNFFFASFIFHILVIVLFLLLNINNKIHKHFLVYGAHSKKPTHAVFKSMRNIPKTNWFAKKLEANKKLQVKKTVKKTIKKKVINVPKKIEKKINTTRKTIPPKKIIAKKILPKKKEIQKKKAVEPEEIHLDLLGNSDSTLALYHKSIQSEVERLWCPPVGVPKGTEASIKFIIDKKGKIENFEIIKKSEILIYDLSILRIARKFKFDKILWGKKITIDFRQ